MGGLERGTAARGRAGPRAGRLSFVGGVRPQCMLVCAPSSVPVSPLRTSLVGEGKSGLPPAGPVPPASEGGDGVENNDILCVRP